MQGNASKATHSEMHIAAIAAIALKFIHRVLWTLVLLVLPAGLLSFPKGENYTRLNRKIIVNLLRSPVNGLSSDSRFLQHCWRLCCSSTVNK